VTVTSSSSIKGKAEFTFTLETSTLIGALDGSTYRCISRTYSKMELYSNLARTSSMIHTTSDGYLPILNQTQGWVYPDPGNIDLNWCPGWKSTDRCLSRTCTNMDLYRNLAKTSSMIHTTSDGNLPILDQTQGWVHPDPGHIDLNWCPGWKYLQMYI
jgi:hypothetical protein